MQESQRHILEILKDFEARGGEFEINWYYKDFDHDIKEDVEDLIDDLDIKSLNLISY